jgi:hypothetical protein
MFSETEQLNVSGEFRVFDCIWGLARTYHRLAIVRNPDFGCICKKLARPHPSL